MKAIKKKDLIKYLESFKQEYIVSNHAIELVPINDVMPSERMDNYKEFLKHEAKYNMHGLTQRGSDDHREYWETMRSLRCDWGSNFHYEKDMSLLRKKKEEFESEINALKYNDHLTDIGKKHQEGLINNMLTKVNRAMQIAESINAAIVELDEGMTDDNVLIFTQ